MTMASVNNGKPDKNCFGILDQVFPMGEAGLREVPEQCLRCSEKTPCLREALGTPEGLAVRSEAWDRMPARGLVDKLRRWSGRKELDRRIKEKLGKKRTWWR